LINCTTETDKSVDDWLNFINGTQNGRKTGKKKRRRRKSTQKKSQQSASAIIEHLEEAIVEQIVNNKRCSVVEENNHNSDLEENCANVHSQKHGRLETLNICSPQLQAEVLTEELDNFELDCYDAEVEAFRKRLAAASAEPSSIFSSID